jgi:uncharacterized protein YkwD
VSRKKLWSVLVAAALVVSYVYVDGTGDSMPAVDESVGTSEGIEIDLGPEWTVEHEGQAEDEVDPVDDLKADAAVEMELAVLDLLNAERADAGLPPLELDLRLADAAWEHSADMASTGACEHEGSDGSTARERIDRSGYPASSYGENIACGSRTPEQALRQWMGSRPHRANILHERFTHVGVGVVAGDRSGAMWTLTFAAGAD